MSAPESGNMFVSHDPLREERWIEIVGAGSVAVTCLMVYIRDGCNSSSMSSCVRIALADVGGILGCTGDCQGCFAWQTLA